MICGIVWSFSRCDRGRNTSIPKKSWAGGSQGCGEPHQSGYGVNPITGKRRRLANDSEKVVTLSDFVRNRTPARAEPENARFYPQLGPSGLPVGARPRLATLDSDGHPPAIYRTYVALTLLGCRSAAVRAIVAPERPEQAMRAARTKRRESEVLPPISEVV
jgi:hypothetical protein